MTDKEVQAKEYLLTIMRGMVVYPESLNVEAKTDELGLNLVVSADRSDIKFLVGREGSVAAALRKILQMYGKQNGARINVYIP